MWRPRSRLLASTTALALVIPLALTAGVLGALPAQAVDEREVSLVGSLQDELGCNAETAKSADFETFSANNTFRPLYGSAKTAKSRVDGRIKVTVPALGVAVWKAKKKTTGSSAAPKIYPFAPGDGGDFSGRAEVRAGLPDRLVPGLPAILAE